MAGEPDFEPVLYLYINLFDTVVLDVDPVLAVVPPLATPSAVGEM